MNKREKIDKIYKEIANKELSFGCKINYDSNNGYAIGFFIEQEDNIVKYLDDYSYPYSICDHNNYCDDIGIIGHPVMIGDVLDYVEDPKDFDYADIYNLCDYWKAKRSPIEEQSEECIDYIYNLIV